jgi:hypothetical protein
MENFEVSNEGPVFFRQKFVSIRTFLIIATTYTGTDRYTVGYWR